MSIVFSPSVYAVLREAGARRGAFGPGASAGNQNKQGSSHLVARHVLPSRLPGFSSDLSQPLDFIAFLQLLSIHISTCLRRRRRTPTPPSVVREDNPGIKFGEVGKMLGEKWKALNEKQRTPYEAKAAADKKRYEEEKAAYQAGEEEEEESE
ncbi:hypothetical protein HBI56_178330 [Parastagonospora nodorum]|nr:hypothetical protein HBI09_049430 [Parastagonospora nodorum]KAH4055333.1 hypothetical protein HBH49_057840 [Parastagonospora nodorum]KAH4071756.1 hypothetical protein HBH50_068190 [Parastagonospora nodorum]KAH4087161.1 hypothetical protein HBH46_202420 [Parastagonospora nodorum]KAH4094640.1 hypothetical protein HBH48_056460 [Parastagonospora nodorum]